MEFLQSFISVIAINTTMLMTLLLMRFITDDYEPVVRLTLLVAAGVFSYAGMSIILMRSDLEIFKNLIADVKQSDGYAP